MGLTNFDTKRMAEMVDAGAEISSNQIQFSLLDRRPLRTMTGYCGKNGEFIFIFVWAIRMTWFFF